MMNILTINLPDIEVIKFRKIAEARAKEYAMSAEEYLQKIWYHENAAKIGEHLAITFLGEMLKIIKH